MLIVTFMIKLTTKRAKNSSEKKITAESRKFQECSGHRSLKQGSYIRVNQVPRGYSGPLKKGEQVDARTLTSPP